MLDWLSRKRLAAEQDAAGSDRPSVGEVLPDYVFQTADGGVVSLCRLNETFALLVLPSELDLAQAHPILRFAEKNCEVRPEITRLVVVTPPEHLSTVVALAGDLMILCDNTGEAMLRLAPEHPILYMLDGSRGILNIIDAEERYASVITRVLRPAV